jgi:hypothetical protein
MNDGMNGDPGAPLGWVGDVPAHDRPHETMNGGVNGDPGAPLGWVGDVPAHDRPRETMNGGVNGDPPPTVHDAPAYARVAGRADAAPEPP